MTNLKRGDIVLVLFPNSDLTTFKRRPVLVVQADGLNTGLAQFVGAMITSNLARRGHPSRVFIPLQSAAARAGALRTDSVVMTDNLATLLDAAIVQKLWSLSDLSDVDKALRVTLGI
jgi:mRNA interferase MazF